MSKKKKAFIKEFKKSYKGNEDSGKMAKIVWKLEKLKKR